MRKLTVLSFANILFSLAAPKIKFYAKFLRRFRPRKNFPAARQPRIRASARVRQTRGRATPVFSPLKVIRCGDAKAHTQAREREGWREWEENRDGVDLSWLVHRQPWQRERERERDDVDVRGISISIAHRIPRVGIKSEKSRAASSTQGYIDRSLPPSFLFPVFCFFLLFLLYFLFFFNFYTSQALISSHTRLSLSRRGMAQARGTLLHLFGIHFIFDDVNIGSTWAKSEREKKERQHAIAHEIC